MILLTLAAQAALAGSLGVKTFPAKPIKKVVVSVESGAISVTGIADGDASVEAVKPEKSTGHCEILTEMQGSELRVEGRKPKGEKAGCDVGFVLKVPRGADLEAFSGSGAIKLVGTRGEAKVRSGSGGVSLDKVESPVHVMTGSGGVSGGLAGSPFGDIRSGSGAVNVVVGKEGTWTIKTGSGAIVVKAPKGAKARAKLDSASGKVKNDVPAGDDAKLSVTAASGSGSVTLTTAR